MNESRDNYDRWHRSMGVSEQDRSVLYPWHRTVLKLLPNLNGKKVLEIGCGRGDFALEIRRRYPSAHITGVDFSTTAIEQARSKLPGDSNLQFLVGDAENLPFSSNSIDFIISCECLEHVEHPDTMIEDVARCLKEDGGFVLTTENYFNGMVLAWINSYVQKRPFDSGSGVQPRENFFTFWHVKRLFRHAGLVITHMESNHYVWLLLPGYTPDTFTTEDFENARLKRLFRPFGRHFTFQGIKPSSR